MKIPLTPFKKGGINKLQNKKKKKISSEE